MEFGIQFFPCVSPDEKAASQYFEESLSLCELADSLGYSYIRTVEHYFERYGGYSPNPFLFLAAAAQRTTMCRLVTGAVLPVFNHPLKIAGEAGMLDAISNGRLELGVARAFLPHEFERFGVSLDESVARFDEGLSQIRQLLEGENISSEGKFYNFKNVTSLPRPTQKPRPAIWTAATSTPESFAKAGERGDKIMAIPIARGRLRELIGIYRSAWKSAGHPGSGHVMLAFHMFCHEDEREAIRIAKPPLIAYLRGIVDATKGWKQGASTKDYPNYDKMVDMLERQTFESQVESGSAWVGTPKMLIEQIGEFVESVGSFESASLQVNFGALALDDARLSMQLFSDRVIPHFKEGS
jgi:alkanesulfonate monooxygenase SsuD/methylene tetrahydromethanopterin reductase-like flavin-dependent oxidoreductase (luciferase family)